jgi:hypothetical protein
MPDVARPVPGGDRPAVDHQVPHPSQRYPRGLHHMAQRTGPITGHLDRPSTAGGLEEQAQRGRDTHLGARPAHLFSIPRAVPPDHQASP